MAMPVPTSHTSTPPLTTPSSTSAATTPVVWPDLDYPIPPLDEGIVLPPSVRIVGYPEAGLGYAFSVIDAPGDAPGVLAASVSDWAYPPFLGGRDLLLFSGDLPRGDHRVTDLWDGVSAADGRWAKPAGDVNADGQPDAWFGGPDLWTAALALGPLLGVHHTDRTRQALIVGGDVVLGGVDADGDGELDVLLDSGELYYGPFAGDIPRRGTPGADPMLSSVLGYASEAWPLPNHRGQGLDALYMGYQVSYEGGGCVFASEIPRGVESGASLGTTREWNSGIIRFAPLDDLDGDGASEVLEVSPTFGISVVLPGPVDGLVPDPLGIDRTDYPRLSDALDVVGSLPDINGDGAYELLGRTDDGFTLLFSPLTLPIDPADGLLIGSTLRTLRYDPTAVDLDGDGLADLIDRADPDPSGGGELRIWYATDLLAAEAARRRAR